MRKDYKTQIAEAAKSRGPLLKPEQAGEYVGYTTGWLAKLRMKGRSGPRYIRLGRKIRYAQGDLDDWIEANRTASTSENADAA